MTVRARREDWGSVAKILHWLMAARIAAMLPFTLNVDSNGQAEMKGQISLDRLKIGLGTGQFIDAAVVSHNIEVEVLAHAKCVP